MAAAPGQQAAVALEKALTTIPAGACAHMLWREVADPLSQTWVPYPAWYGSSPAWRVALEATARRGLLADRLTVTGHRGLVEYRALMDLRGPNDLVPITVQFYDNPPYATFGLNPADYPRVFAEPGRPSKHRMPDDALCLYYPKDPPARRWTADKGLLDLLYTAADHLLYEDYWRTTGGTDGGVWLSDEVEHGLPGVAA